MRRSLSLAFATSALVATATPALAQQLPTDPFEIPCGKLTGWYTATLESQGGTTEVRATITSSAAGSAVLHLEGRDHKLVKKNGQTEAKLVSVPGVVGQLGQAEGTVVDLTITDRVTLKGSITEKSQAGATKTGVTLRRAAAPARTPEELAEFDPGPPEDMKALFAEIPDAYKPYFKYMWYRFGPVFYRGRLDKSARLLLMGSDPGPTECLPWTRRCFIGDSGQRMQGFFTKLGLTRSYVCINAMAFALFPSASNAGKADQIHNDPAIVAWRNKIYSSATGPNLQAIVVVGFQAKNAYDAWTDKPNVPMFYLPHPSRFDAEPDSNLIPRYRSAVDKLRKIVTPDDPELLANTPNYGEEFTEFDFSPIPRRDLPKGGWIDNEFVPTPEWIGSDSWTRVSLKPIHNVCRRPSPDTGDALILTQPDGKVRRIVVTPHPTGDPLRNPRFHWDD